MEKRLKNLLKENNELSIRTEKKIIKTDDVTPQIDIQMKKLQSHIDSLEQKYSKVESIHV